MRISRAFIAVAVIAGAFSLPSLPARACAQGASSIYLALGEFPNEHQFGRWFYYASEAQAAATFEVHRISDDCSDPPKIARTSFVVESGTATAGEDFEATQGQTQALYDPSHGDGKPSSEYVQITLKDDAVTEAPVESALIRLYDPEGATYIDPSEAPLHIIDDDGASRFSFGDATYSQSETNTIAKIPVFRAGDVSAPGDVTFTLTPSTTSPATAGKDYVAPADSVVSFPAGDRVQAITLQVVNDSRGEGPERVDIDLTGADAAGITKNVLTILDNEESIAPKTSFHHPRAGVRYEYNDYRLREIHVFATDNKGGSGVVRVQMALRRKKTDGTCAWWDGDGFARGRCDRKSWVKMRYYESSGLYFLRFPKFRPSVGTSLRNYTAFSRARDGAGNVESAFKSGRNANTFEVAPAD